MASEELRKTETILFEKETRELDFEHRAKDLRAAIAHLKRVTGEKEDELRCKKDEIKRKREQLDDEEDRLHREEEEVEDETSCARYCISELKKKL